MSVNADDSVLDALTTLQADAYGSSAPDSYIRALNRGAPGSRHRITLDGSPAHITIATPSTGPRRDGDSYHELLTAMRAAVTDGIQPELPPEISMVVWHHQGREVRVCAPGSAPALRRARIRRRLSALSPLPLLGAITQPLAGGATAVGIAVAPVIPPMHQPDVLPAPIVRDLTGDVARPGPPYAPGHVPRAPEGLPWTIHVPAPAGPVEATAKDTTPTPARPPLLDAPPATAAPNPARTAPAPDPTPTPELAPSEDATEAPATPALPPVDAPTTEAGSDPAAEPSPEPTPTPTTTASSAGLTAPALHPILGHNKRHHRHASHHRHGHRGG